MFFFFSQITYQFVKVQSNINFNEPIDIVYTWVNGSDPKFLSDLNEFLKLSSSQYRDISQQRFDDKYELKFSLR